MLMVGVTLSLGSMVFAAASTQFGAASESASLGASIREGAAGAQLSLAYGAVSASGSCPSYHGYQEGSEMTLALYDYGSEGFSPAGFVVNSTLYAGNFTQALPGTLTRYVLQLGGCAHQPGQTILAYDSSGKEVQFET